MMGGKYLRATGTGILHIYVAHSCHMWNDVLELIVTSRSSDAADSVGVSRICVTGNCKDGKGW